MPIANKISTLWIVVLFNMVFADILSFMYPGFLAKVSTGEIDGVTITPGFLLVAAVFVEIAIAMIFLTLALRQRTARTVNLIAVVITIMFVVAGGSLTAHYIFFASIEVIVLIYIAKLAWAWR
jgi:hypothetical protein